MLASAELYGISSSLLSENIITTRQEKTMKDYYSGCAVPKPKSKKKTLLYNGYKGKKERFCRYCGTPYAERHEIFGGPNRQNSIMNGFQVDLCHTCHEEIQQHKNARGIMRDTELKMEAQKKYEDRLIEGGIKPEQARASWMSLIGRNYLDA